MQRKKFDLSGKFWVHVNMYNYEGSGFDSPQWSFDTAQDALAFAEEIRPEYRFSFATEPRTGPHGEYRFNISDKT